MPPRLLSPAAKVGVYLPGLAFYRITLRLPVGLLWIHDLTLGLLKPFGVFGCNNVNKPTYILMQCIG